jgi:hypothetical protein
MIRILIVIEFAMLSYISNARSESVEQSLRDYPNSTNIISLGSKGRSCKQRASGLEHEDTARCKRILLLQLESKGYTEMATANCGSGSPAFT